MPARFDVRSGRVALLPATYAVIARWDGEIILSDGHIPAR
jgi:hypothetical protein